MTNVMTSNLKIIMCYHLSLLANFLKLTPIKKLYLKIPLLVKKKTTLPHLKHIQLTILTGSEILCRLISFYEPS